MKVYNIEDVKLSELVYSQPRQNVMGGQTVSVTMPTVDPKAQSIVIQTPKCGLPFGLNVFKTPQGDRYSIDLSLSGDTVAMSRFRDFARSFDSANVNRAALENQNWFGKRVSRDVVSEIYKPQLRKNGDYPPMFRAKLPTGKNGEFLGDIFDQDKNPIRLESISKGCTVQAILQCVGMYFVAKEFGMTWKVVQLKVFPPVKLDGYSFIDDDDEEDEAEPV